MQRGNGRLPMLSIQNKNENSSNQSKMKSKNIDQNMMVVDDNKNNIKAFGKSDVNFSNIEATEKQQADGEYLKNVQKALQIAINENEELREKIKLLVNENSELKDEIEDKNFALIELAQFYEFCQKNHKSDIQNEINPDNSKKKKNTRKSKSL